MWMRNTFTAHMQIESFYIWSRTESEDRLSSFKRLSSVNVGRFLSQSFIQAFLLRFLVELSFSRVMIIAIQTTDLFILFYWLEVTNWRLCNLTDHLYVKHDGCTFIWLSIHAWPSMRPLSLGQSPLHALPCYVSPQCLTDKRNNGNSAANYQLA